MVGVFGEPFNCLEIPIAPKVHLPKFSSDLGWIGKISFIFQHLLHLDPEKDNTHPFYWLFLQFHSKSLWRAGSFTFSGFELTCWMCRNIHAGTCFSRKIIKRIYSCKRPKKKRKKDSVVWSGRIPCLKPCPSEATESRQHLRWEMCGEELGKRSCSCFDYCFPLWNALPGGTRLPPSLLVLRRQT